MTYNICDSIKAQKERGNKYVPKDGVCWNCRKNIYQPLRKTIMGVDMIYSERITGYTVEEARTKNISHCPHCNKSFIS